MAMPALPLTCSTSPITRSPDRMRSPAFGLAFKYNAAHAFLDRCHAFHAADDFLADKTALGEIDPVKQLHIGVGGEDLAVSKSHSLSGTPSERRCAS